MVGYFWNRPGVTWLTSLSVDCADRIVATSSSQGVRCTSAQTALGYISSSRRRISLTRAWRSAAFLGRAILFLRAAFAAGGMSLGAMIPTAVRPSKRLLGSGARSEAGDLKCREITGGPPQRPEARAHPRVLSTKRISKQDRQA